MKFIRLFVLLLLCQFVFSVPVFAVENCPSLNKPTPRQLETARKNASDHGFLWRISKDGRTSYLYGTMHIAKFEWMFPGPQVMQALRNTDTIALELDVLDPEMKRKTEQGVKALRKTALPEAMVNRIRKLAESVCVPYEHIAELPPELQIGTLETLMGRPGGLEPEYAIDTLLAVMGHQSQKTVVSLETPEFQLAQLQMATPEETISVMQDDLDLLDKENGHTYIEQVANIWGSSDYDKMANFASWCKCMDTEIERKTMKRMLDDRNPGMADRIDALHASGKQVFAAVGSMHMFGALGLPLLMEKRGYKVERITLQPR